jgi:hypothetical protein
MPGLLPHGAAQNDHVKSEPIADSYLAGVAE